MNKTRLEAFSDGVFAIIITIMVLELKVPDHYTFDALKELAPVFSSYLLSFIFVGIYWNNHHHMLATVKRINGAIMWANLHLLFWLSIFPFVTAWVGNSHVAPVPTATYGVVFLFAAIAYTLLQQLIIIDQGPDSPLKAAIQGDFKGKASALITTAAIVTAFFSSYAAAALLVACAGMWFIPDRRIATTIDEE